MGLKRLSLSTPAASTPTTLFTADNYYLASVIATNKTGSVQSIRIWVEPSGSTQDSQYAYIIYDLPVDANNSYETFRFAIDQTDTVKVYASSASMSFSLYGIVQTDLKIAFGTSSYSPNPPAYPVAGMIWVDSDGVSPNNSTSKPTYVWDGENWLPMSAAQPVVEPAHTDIILAQRMFG